MMLRGVCIRGAGCINGKSWEMGFDCDKKVGGYSGAGVQRSIVVGARVGDEVVECLAERMDAWATGLWGQ